ncbi:MAG: methionine synthase [Pseudomonadota bacterium]
MTDEPNPQDNDDGSADAFAATAVIALVVLTVYFWLSGMPS